MTIKVEIDDRQIMDFIRRSPKRANWALMESLKMAGGHFGTKRGGKNSLRTWMQTRTRSLAELHPVTVAGQRTMRSPLFNLHKMVSFKFMRSKGIPQVRIGWLAKGAPKIARALLFGKRIRITPQVRELFHRRGVHLRKTTKMRTVPARPALDQFWRSKVPLMFPYIERNFFLKFFGKQRASLRF